MTDEIKFSIVVLIIAIVVIVFVKPLNQRFTGLFPEGTHEGEEIKNANKIISKEFTKQTTAKSKTTASAKTNGAASDENISYDIKKRQLLLRKAGFYKGKIDGKIGPQTTQAIKQFQKSKKLKESGNMNIRTWEEIKKNENGDKK